VSFWCSFALGTCSHDHAILILIAPQPGRDGHDRIALDEKIILLVDYDYTRNLFGTQYVVIFLYTRFIQLLLLPSRSMHGVFGVLK